ncbi:hypothetical protein D3C75_551390 [compost metagenome]
MEFWNEYEKMATEFLTHVFEIYHKQSGYDMYANNQSIDFNIDFRIRNYTMSPAGEEFVGFREFAIKNLGMEIVERLVRNSLKESEK